MTNRQPDRPIAIYLYNQKNTTKSLKTMNMDMTLAQNRQSIHNYFSHGREQFMFTRHENYAKVERTHTHTNTAKQTNVSLNRVYHMKYIIIFDYIFIAN